VVDIDADGTVTKFREKPKTTDLVNIGYFIFESSIFDYLSLDSTLEEEPLRALAAASQLSTYRHDGFWQPMDTYREAQLLNEHWQSGAAPWKIWN
jgi:glucose-1-phosphate cytidylyltransferase